MKLIPHVLADIRFKTTEEGGRTSPILGPIYGCPMLVNGQGFDCRIHVDEPLEPGKRYILPLMFMSPDEALAQLEVGSSVELWEGRVIAQASIVEICR